MRKLSFLILVVLGLSFSTTSHAFLDFFKKDLDKVPETEEMRAQEAAANLKVTEAMEYEAAGKTDKAFGIYKEVVKKFPVTTSAAMSQYKIGAIQEGRGNLVKAFDSFQTFVDDYKQSSAFDAAIASQFEIAKACQTGEHKEKFIGISRKVQPSDILEMYRSVVKNAPYSEYAPQAQFAIGEVLEKDKKGPGAVVAYKKVVESYPKTPLAAEAQFKIGEIGSKAIEDGSRNIANVKSSRRAYEEILIGYDEHERRDEAVSRVAEFDELEARKALDVGRFYEKQKQYKSAALYYRRVAQSTGTSAALEAQERLPLVEAKINVGPTSVAVEPSAAAKPEKKSLRPKFGSRLFGRKKRAEREAEEAAEMEAEMAANGDLIEPPVVANKPVAAPVRKPLASPSRPSSQAGSNQVAAVVPNGTKTSKRKGYYGPPKPNLELGKKQNRMRLDTSGIQGVPFDIGKLDKGDLEKGLKMISEQLPEGVPSELPEGLPDLVIPPDFDEEVAAAVEENEDGLKIPPPPEDDGE